jgi:hypothetical protein
VSTAADRARRYRRRIGPRNRPELARGVVHAEVNLAALDDAIEVLHRYQPGAWPRRRRTPGVEPTLPQVREARNAMAAALIEWMAKEIVTRDGAIGADAVMMPASRHAIPVAPILTGQHQETRAMAASPRSALAEKPPATFAVVDPAPAPASAPAAPAVRARVRDSGPRRPFAPPADTQPADLKWTSWQHVAPGDCEIEDVLEEQYFRTKVEHMRPGHTIEVRSADFRFWLRLLVMAVDRTAKVVRTFVLDKKELPGQQVAKLNADMLRIVPIDGPEGQSFIVRYGPHTNVATFPSRSQAEAYIATRKDEAA